MHQKLNSFDEAVQEIAKCKTGLHGSLIGDIVNCGIPHVFIAEMLIATSELFVRYAL